MEKTRGFYENYVNTDIKPEIVLVMPQQIIWEFGEERRMYDNQYWSTTEYDRTWMRKLQGRDDVWYETDIPSSALVSGF